MCVCGVCVCVQAGYSICAFFLLIHKDKLHPTLYTIFDPKIQVLCISREYIVFGVSSSSFLLNATIDHHPKLFFSTTPEVIEVLRRSIYVDDKLAGALNEDGLSYIRT